MPHPPLPPLPVLPPEVLGHIMRYMTPSCLSRAIQVNHFWSHLARSSRQNHQLWSLTLNSSPEKLVHLKHLIQQATIKRLQIDTHSRHISIPDLSTPHPFLTELIIYHQRILPSSFYPIFVTHAATLQALEIHVSVPCDFDIVFTLDTLPNLRSLVLSHTHWYARVPLIGINFVGCRVQNPGRYDQQIHIDDKTKSWMQDPERLYPNLHSLDLRCIRGYPILGALLKKLPNLKTLKLMRCGSEALCLFTSFTKQYLPHLRAIGASDKGFNHELLSWVIRSNPNVETIEWPTAEAVPATFDRLARSCTSLKDLDFKDVQFTERMSETLFNLLCEPTPLNRIVAPLAIFKIRYALEKEKEGIVWQASRLETLVVQFDCSLENNAAGSIKVNGVIRSASSSAPVCLTPASDIVHTCESSGTLFRYLAKYCPRLMYLRSFIQPQICLGQKGLKQLAGLQQLGELDLFVNRLDAIQENDILWLQHESVHAIDERYGNTDDGYYWPRLETIRITVKDLDTSMKLTQWIDSLSLRFTFKIESDEKTRL
ncbi:hypothetical protein BGX21_006759 [Mortierella sp. AD011]|nr:hypothetical protein BGX20_006775 [Mortierella sp. AD010]KAF9399127.1 hypothetical protein BGX21_006759 [Mortierella sp. AD011]